MINQDWTKSSYSQKGASNCVECRGYGVTNRKIEVRDTQNPILGHLSFPPAEWDSFIQDVKAEEL